MRYGVIGFPSKPFFSLKKLLRFTLKTFCASMHNIRAANNKKRSKQQNMSFGSKNISNSYIKSARLNKSLLHHHSFRT